MRRSFETSLGSLVVSDRYKWNSGRFWMFCVIEDRLVYPTANSLTLPAHYVDD